MPIFHTTNEVVKMDTGSAESSCWTAIVRPGMVTTESVVLRTLPLHPPVRWSGNARHRHGNQGWRSFPFDTQAHAGQ